MERDLGLYVCLCSDGTVKRTLRSARGETELGDTTIGDALIDFSELNFENYAKILEITEKVLPLHPLSRTNETSSKTRLKRVRGKRIKKEFFEKIYIRQIK